MTGKDSIFRPEDTAFVVYLVTVAVLVSWFHQGVDKWRYYVLAHSLAACLVVPWLRFSDRHRHPVIKFFRYWYIPIVLGFFYEQINGYVLGIHGRFMDHIITGFEISLLGVHPSVWLERFASPPLTEAMKFFYNSYYWLGPVLGISLYFKGQYMAFRRTLFSIVTAFFISYLGFYIFPVEGPRFTLSNLYKGPLEGYVVTALQDFIMEVGDIHGGCMPSSHVAVALVVLLLAWVYRRKMAVWMTPFVTMLCISTVYNRYHYLSDVAAGLAVGLFSFWLGKKIYGDANEGELGRAGEGEKRLKEETS
jgi:membrane-associated phospholipid phosphatase